MPGPSPYRRSTDPGLVEPELLVRAYAAGYFPMGGDDGPVRWYSPDPRGILPLDEFHVPHGLRRTLRRNPFEIRVDSAFLEVMHGCGEREDSWIDDTIRRSYGVLHLLGLAHSVEAWREGVLAGGLYGVALGGAFFGESMFSRVTDASKVCLAHLVDRLRVGGFVLLDTQWTTPHLERFGAREVPRSQYLGMLRQALKRRGDWSAVEGETRPDGEETTDQAGGGIPSRQPPMA